jgi:hypothetical protein
MALREEIAIFDINRGIKALLEQMTLDEIDIRNCLDDMAETESDLGYYSRVGRALDSCLIVRDRLIRIGD